MKNDPKDKSGRMGDRDSLEAQETWAECGSLWVMGRGRRRRYPQLPTPPVAKIGVGWKANPGLMLDRWPRPGFGVPHWAAAPRLGVAMRRPLAT